MSAATPPDGTGTAPDGTGGPVGRDAYRAAMGRFATGVTIVTARGRHPHAMTANSLASVSLDPPTLLVCVEQDARVHDAVVDDGRFGVSVLGADQARISDWLASRGRPLVGQLDQVPTVTGAVLGLPLVAGALAQLECEVSAVHPAGDHSIVVGTVRGLTLPEHQDDPLVWFASAYRRLAGGAG
ncbi:flavin reductase family protein [Jannaschia sp. R86511]|uniref:flavin reductase family protein n=1 Tax=Jannaschia sp. R86511 TaxID=3093853 RepID=UPI0036D406E8